MEFAFSSEFWENTLKLIGVRTWALIKILIFFLVVRFIAYRLINRVMRTLVERETGTPAPIVAGRIRTLGSLIKSTVFYVLVFVTGVMVLNVFDVEALPVLTAAGVVGLAVGFGAQRLVRDIISGFFIILENQYSVGEYITIGLITGTVEDMGMRVTQLRDDVGKLVIIANGDITQITNHSRGPIQAVVEVNVASDSDLDRVRGVIAEVGAGIAKEIEGVITPPTADGITAVDGAKMTLRVVGEVKAGRQFAVQAALRERIRERFRAEEIRLV